MHKMWLWIVFSIGMFAGAIYIGETDPNDSHHCERPENRNKQECMP